MKELKVNPLHPIFAAEVIGADLTVEPSEELVKTVHDAMDQYAVVVMRDCDVTDDEHIRFSRCFGPLELPPRMGIKPENGPRRRRMRPEMFFAGNLDENGEIIPYNSDLRKLAKGAEKFHTDSSFNVLPTKWSLLRGVIVPPVGGDTHFVDTRAAYDNLADEMKDKIEGLVAIHDFWRGRELTTGLEGVTDEQRKTMPAVQHRLVREMPYGRKAIYIGGHATGIVGWPEDKGLALLDELYNHCTQEKYNFEHKWKPGDIVIWDNRCTLHRATPFTYDEYKRDVRRTTINEYGPERSADRDAA